MKRLHLRIALWSGGLLAVSLVVLLVPVPLTANSTDSEVVSPADHGPGTLRQALLDAEPDVTITFSPSAFPPGSPVTIFAQSGLPTLNKDNVTIDASNAGVILDGSSIALPNIDGLVIEGDNCVVRGLTIQNFPSNGIFVAAGATGNTIGGDRAVGDGPSGQGNIIVYNGASGVSIRGDANLVRGNFIGNFATIRESS